MFKPDELQEEAIQEGLKVLTDKKGRSEGIIGATGSGKSIIIAEITNRLPKNGNIVVVQPSKVLLEQNLSKIEKLGVKPAVYSASFNRKEIGRVTYATAMSLKNTNDFKNKNIKYLIVDEGDKGSKSGSILSKFKKDLKIKSVLALTATPIYLNTTREGSKLVMMNQVRGSFIKDFCYVINPNQVVAKKRWCKLKYHEYDFDAKGLITNSSGSDWTEASIVNNYIESDRESQVISVIDTIDASEPILVFIPGIDNVEKLASKIGGKATYIHSKLKTKERDERIDLFKSGKKQVMINDSTLIEGFDFPELVHVIDTSPTKSARIYIQKNGRVVRWHDNKEFGHIHDLAGNTSQFGKVEDINFDKVGDYGWGMFSGDNLLTNVPIGENIKITKEYLLSNPNFNKNGFHFKYSFTDDPIIKFGKHSGKKVSQIYETDKGYLKWLIKPETNFNFSRYKGLKEVIENIFKSR